MQEQIELLDLTDMFLEFITETGKDVQLSNCTDVYRATGKVKKKMG